MFLNSAVIYYNSIFQIMLSFAKLHIFSDFKDNTNKKHKVSRVQLFNIEYI